MQKKNKFSNFIECFVFLFVVYAIMFEKHYATDSYYYDHFYYIDPFIYGVANKGLGRWGAYIANNITSVIHFNCVEQQFWVVLILVALLALSCSTIWGKYKEWYRTSTYEQDILIKLSIILLYCNVFILEWFIFVEMDIVWGLAVLFMTLAVARIDEKMSLKSMILIYLLEVISLSFYQATLGYFITFGLLFCLIQCKCEINKESVLRAIKVIIIGALASATNIIYLRAVQWMGIVAVKNRTESISFFQIFENLKKIFLPLKNWLFNANGLLPDYSVLVVFIITYILFIIWNIKCVKCLKKSIFFCFIIVVSFGCVIAPHIMTSSLWMAQRTIVCFFNIISLPWMIMVLEEKKDSFLIKSGVFLLMCFLLVNIVKIQSVAANVIATNKIDAEIAFSIQHMIEKYQEESGNTIKNVCFVKDSNVRTGYKSTDYTAIYDTNRKAFSVEWSAVNCLNYYNGTNYIQVEPDYELVAEQIGKDWQALDLPEQMIYDGDTVYIITY